jgi:hypothetical protein
VQPPAKAFAILIGYALLGVELSAQAPSVSNEDCQSCHAEPSMVRADGRPVVVDPAAFGESVHSSFGCVDCHTDLAKTEFPHAERLQPVNCSACHEQAVTLFDRSVHAMIPASDNGPLRCASCHGPPHQMRSSSDPESLTDKNRLVTTCGQCHGDKPVPGLPRGPAVAGLFTDSIHGRALTRTTVAPTCSNCHRSHDIRRKMDAESPVHPPNIPATCGTCHANQQRLYGESVHAELLTKGTAEAPQCVSCHSAHSVRTTALNEWQTTAVEQCGTCHREALATFRDTFHGQVTTLGFTPVARCVTCHDSHQILRISNPASPVSTVNRLTTCRTCHPSANENFAKYQPHANKENREQSPELYYAAKIMDGLFIGVFLFFGLHTVLWFARERTAPPGPPAAHE